MVKHIKASGFTLIFLFMLFLTSCELNDKYFTSEINENGFDYILNIDLSENFEVYKTNTEHYGEVENAQFVMNLLKDGEVLISEGLVSAAGLTEIPIVIDSKDEYFDIIYFGENNEYPVLMIKIIDVLSDSAETDFFYSFYTLYLEVDNSPTGELLILPVYFQDEFVKKAFYYSTDEILRQKDDFTLISNETNTEIVFEFINNTAIIKS